MTSETRGQRDEGMWSRNSSGGGEGGSRERNRVFAEQMAFFTCPIRVGEALDAVMEATVAHRISGGFPETERRCLGVCAATVVVLDTVHADEGVIFRRIEALPVAVGTAAGDKGSCVIRLRVVLDRWDCGRHSVDGAGERRRSADDNKVVVTKGLRPKP